MNLVYFSYTSAENLIRSCKTPSTFPLLSRFPLNVLKKSKMALFVDFCYLQPNCFFPQMHVINVVYFSYTFPKGDKWEIDLKLYIDNLERGNNLSMLVKQFSILVATISMRRNNIDYFTSKICWKGIVKRKWKSNKYINSNRIGG